MPRDVQYELFGPDRWQADLDRVSGTCPRQLPAVQVLRPLPERGW
jgi:hypothetical protein